MNISSTAAYPSSPTFARSSSLAKEKAPAAENDAPTDQPEQAAKQSDTNARASQQAQQVEVQKLKNRDREVRAHELAHLSAGGQYITSGAQYTFQKGPDGRLYAVGGEVGIDTSPVVGDPRATLMKAQVIMQAALAPAEPSAQDRQVAARAAVMLQQARVALQSTQDGRAKSENGQRLDIQA